MSETKQTYEASHFDRLLLTEEGSWQTTRANDPHYDQWIGIGWQVCTPGGMMLYRHQKRETAIEWLAANRYTAEADGCHYRLTQEK